MKHISQLTNVACLTTAREEKVESNTLDPVCAQLVDQVFIKFALLCREYDAMYADKRRENAEKLQWTLAFTKHNLRSKNQIQYALDQTEVHKWGKPPQLGQFLEWCRPSPEALGFPTFEQAYQASIQVNRQFSDYKHQDDRVDAVIRHAVAQIGSMTYREMKIENARKAFKSYYEIALQQFIDGELKVIPKQLPEKAEAHPADKPRNDEARKKAMASIFKDLNVKRTDDTGLQENPI